MSLQLEELVDEVATVDVYRELNKLRLAGKLNVKYKVYADTAPGRMELAQTVDSERRTDLVRMDYESLCDTVIEWDLMANGQVIPLTPQAIMEAEVPAQVLDDIGTAIRSHRAGPNQKRGKS